MSCSFNSDLVSTTLNSQKVRRAVSWVTHSVLTPFWPHWLFRMYPVAFDDLLTKSSSRFNHFELSARASCHFMRWKFYTDLVSMMLNFQDFFFGPSWVPHSSFTHVLFPLCVYYYFLRLFPIPSLFQWLRTQTLLGDESTITNYVTTMFMAVASEQSRHQQTTRVAAMNLLPVFESICDSTPRWRGSPGIAI